eukprot:Unigene3826_Nuclearia_a/m.11665 Unigene3826_Nuclearia_a/g.11665  ORF Unigene3826_Nuclearia_a/g.11665 Unigene3826_Nuclearia_a/m.11665 type:complete len:304 (+) Unigene3826_Nuclearia_a:986-1897(+)
MWRDQVGLVAGDEPVDRVQLVGRHGDGRVLEDGHLVLALRQVGDGRVVVVRLGHVGHHEAVLLQELHTRVAALVENGHERLLAAKDDLVGVALKHLGEQRQRPPHRAAKVAIGQTERIGHKDGRVEVAQDDERRDEREALLLVELKLFGREDEHLLADVAHPERHRRQVVLEDAQDLPSVKLDALLGVALPLLHARVRLHLLLGHVVVERVADDRAVDRLGPQLKRAVLLGLDHVLAQDVLEARDEVRPAVVALGVAAKQLGHERVLAEHVLGHGRLLHLASDDVLAQLEQEDLLARLEQVRE